MSTYTLTAVKGSFALAGGAVGLPIARTRASATGALTINQQPGFGSVLGQPVSVQLFWQNHASQYFVPVEDPIIVIVTLDIIEDSDGTHDLIPGGTIVRSAIVEGLNPGGTDDTNELISDAETAVGSITGFRGAQVTIFDVPAFIQKFHHKIINHTTVKVLITYRGYQLPTLEFDSSLNSVKSNIDADGNNITASYQFPADYIWNVQARGQKDIQPGWTQRTVAEPLAIYRWIQVSNDLFSATTAITLIKAAYENTINNAPYTIGSLTGAKHTWWIEKVGGITRDGGLTYESMMIFHLRPTGWDEQEAYVDPNTGLPPQTNVVASTTPGQYGTLSSIYGLVLVRAKKESSFPPIIFSVN